MLMPFFEGRPMKQVREAVERFQAERPRLDRLGRYFEGRHDILSRSRRPGLPNARLPHGFPKYIAELSAGYMLAEPVQYRLPEGGEEMRAFHALLRRAADDALDMDLALNQSVFGRGVSLLYGGKEKKLTSLDPRSAFVVYDDTVEKKPLMGILIGAEETYVYTQREELVFGGGKHQRFERPDRARPHGFTGVPMVDYLNNAQAQGDFEDVLPLVDAYDLLASDRVNDRGQFADAMLVLTGVMGLGTASAPDDPLSAARLLRQERTLSLPDADSKAEWLVKDPVEKDIDVLRIALANDIHKFSMTPDLDDDRFAGNLSGVAIRYKLFCLERKTRIKERWFVKGLRERARLLCGVLQSSGLPSPDPEQMEILIPRQRVEE